MKNNVIDEARRTVKHRAVKYNNPVANFQLIAELSSMLLRRHMTPREIALIMIAVKLSREVYHHNRDNIVDLIGYSYILSKIEGDE